MAFDKTQPYATVNTDAGNIYYLQGGTFYQSWNLAVVASPPAPVDYAAPAAASSTGAIVVRASGDASGATDNANINQAFSRITAAGSGTLVFGAGTYYVPQSTFVNANQIDRVLPANIRISGAGIGKTIIKYVWDGVPTNIQANIFLVNGVNNWEIQDMTLDYQFPYDPRTAAYSTDNDSYWNCIRVSNSSNWRVNHCELMNAGFHGLIGVANCANVEISDCVMHDNGSRGCHLHAEASAGNSTIRIQRNTLYRDGRGPAFSYNCTGTMVAGSNVLTIPTADFTAMSTVWPQVGAGITALVKGAGWQGGDLIATVASNDGVSTLTFTSGQIATIGVTSASVSFFNIGNTGIFAVFGGSDALITDNYIYDENGAGIAISNMTVAIRNLVNSSKGNVSTANLSKMWLSQDTQASGALSFFNGNPTNGQTIVINGTTITFVTSGATGAQVNLGGSLSATLTNLQTLMSGGTVIPLTTMTSFVTSSQLYLTAGSSYLNTAGNALTLGAGTYGATLSAATLTNGATGDYTKAKAAIVAAGQNNIRVNVTRGGSNNNTLVDILGSTMTLNDSEYSIAFSGLTFEIGTDYNLSFLTIVGSGGNLPFTANKIIVKNNIISGCVYGISSSGYNLDMDNTISDSKLYGLQLGVGSGVTVKGQVLRSGVSNISFNPGTNNAISEVNISALCDTSGSTGILFNIAGASGAARNITLDSGCRVFNAGSNPNFLTSANLLGFSSASGAAFISDGTALYKTLKVSGGLYTKNAAGGIRFGSANIVHVADTIFQDNGTNVAASNASDIFAAAGCTNVAIFNTRHDNIDYVSNNQLVFSAAGGGVAGLTLARTETSYNRAGGGGAVIQLGANSTNVRHWGNIFPAISSLTGPVYPTANKVTQATSRSTGVTLSTLTGQITGNAASLAAQTAVSFTVTNTLVEANDVIGVSIQSGAPNTTTVSCSAVAAGSFQLTLYNDNLVTADTTVPVINFTVQKAFSALSA